MALDRDIILEQAFAILNESGPDSLTLRRLAQRLGVQAPAIYWHFKNKQELWDEMGTRVFREAAEWRQPEWDGPGTQSWQEWARGYAQGLRQTLLRYREGARMFSGTAITDPALFASLDASLRRLTDAGFSFEASLASLTVLYSYTIGFVIEEQAVHPAPGEENPVYDPKLRAERIDKERFPLAHAAGPPMAGGAEVRFDGGLQIILQGMAAMLTTQPSTQASVV